MGEDKSLSYLLTTSVYICDSQWQNQIINCIGKLSVYFLHLLPGSSTSQESSARGNVVAQGLMANFVCVLSYQDGIKQALSDWRPIFTTKVKASENGHSGESER